MQTSLSFEKLQHDMPETLAKIIARARDSKSRRFDASTDPSAWSWSVDWAEREPALAPGADPLTVAKGWDDLRLSGPDAYVRERIRQKAMLPSLRLKTGPTAIVEPLTADGELPSEWVSTFALKTYEPLVWNGAVLLAYQPTHPTRPGLAEMAVFAGYATSSGGFTVLIAEGHHDREFNTLWTMSVDEKNRSAVVNGVLSRDKDEWDVAVGATITVNDEKWRRLDHLDVERRIKMGPWLRSDSRAAREAQTLMGMEGLSVPPRVAASLDLSNLPSDTPYWPVGAARSDEDVLRDKWAGVTPALTAGGHATNDERREASLTSAAEQADHEQADQTAPAAQPRKRPTTVAGSVKANDPEALLDALAENAKNGIDLSDSEHAQPMSTLLLTAVASASPRVVEILIEHGANPHHRSRKGQTVTISAANAENVATMEWLHAHQYLDVTESDGNGNTVLMQAVETKKFIAAETLLKLGADINGSNLFSHTALHQAASKGHGEAVKWLIEHDADPNRENFQDAIAEEMVPVELPEMVDVLADYRFTRDKGEVYALPPNFLESLKNQSQHPSMQQEAPSGPDGVSLGGGLVDISGLDGVMVVSGDDFNRALNQHGVEGVVAAGQNGTLGAMMGRPGADAPPTGEQILHRIMASMDDEDNAEPQAPATPVNANDYLFEHLGYGDVIPGMPAHMVIINPRAYWEAENAQDDQPHPELLSILPPEWQPEDINECGTWVFVTRDSEDSVTERLKALGFQQKRLFSMFIRGTMDGPLPLGDETPPSDEPTSETPRRPRMR